MTLLSLKNVSFAYLKNKYIFKNICFDIQPGEIFCIMGPNGCGKSTLIDNIIGINKPLSGTITLGDQSIFDLKPKDFAQHIAYVPQSHTKTFPYTVLDVVIMGRTFTTSFFSSPNNHQRSRAIESLYQVGLKGFENRLYTELSGGELQLVLIARALTQDAEIMVLDEPTAHLDFSHELMVMEIITWLVKEKNISVIMATHFLNQAYYLETAKVKTRVALMNQGEINLIGSPSEILTEKHLKDVFHIITTLGTTSNSGEIQKYIIPLKKDV